MRRKLLLVGAGLMGRGYVIAARRLGLEVILIDRAARQAEYADLVDEFQVCPGQSEEAWLAAALDASAAKPDGVLAFSESQVLAAAWVQERLGLPGPSLQAAQACRNKALQRVLFDRAGIGQPQFHIVSAAEPAIEWARSRYPVVVKPLRGTGSAGVRLVHDELELAEFLGERRFGESLLVEEYISAPEYSWEALVQDGQVRFGNYTAKQTSGPPNFVELGHVMPAGLTASERDLLDKAMVDAVGVLSISTALVHQEFRFDGQRSYIMETAVRAPGDYLMELLGLAYGYDFFEAMVRLAMGETIETPTAPVSTAAVGFLTAQPGTLQAVTGMDDARKLEGVVRVALDKDVGDIVGVVESSDDVVAHVLTVGASDEAPQRVVRALALLHAWSDARNMSVQFEPGTISRATWDELTGSNFYSSANWLDFCATEHGGRFDAVVAPGNGPAVEVAVPLLRGTNLTGSPYDWNAQLAKRSLPTLAADGLLVGPREGYQTHILQATPQSTPLAMAQLLAELRARAEEDACVAMYLNTEGVRLFRTAGVEAPAVLLEPDAWLPVPDGGFDAWFATLGKKRRISVRREITEFTSAGYRIQHLPLRECSTAIVPLAIRTEAKYGFIATLEEDLASFGNHEKCFGDAAMVALCTLDDTAVGFCLYYVWRDTIFIRWTGFDYPRLRNTFEYFNLLYYEQLRWAAGRGIRWIHAGLKATKAKVLRGAIVHPLWLLDLSATSPLIDAQQAVHDHNAAFLNQLLADNAIAGGIADLTEWRNP